VADTPNIWSGRSEDKGNPVGARYGQQAEDDALMKEWRKGKLVF
jgi:hypothetical protein